MSNNDITPLPAQALTTDSQVRAYVHPTRMVILTLLAKEKETVSGIARQLGVHPANLTHHFKLLEKAGLIRLVEKRDTGKNLAKYYRAVAHSFSVNLVTDEPVNKKALVLAILRDNLSAALAAVKTQEQDALVMGCLETVYLGAGNIERFQASLADLLTEFSTPHPGASSAYQVNISLYPGETALQPSQEIFLRPEE